MDKLPYRMLTNVLEVIGAANESLDVQLVRRKALHALFRTISAEGGIFFLPDGNGHLTNILLENLDKGYCKYYKTYYYRFDPLKLTQGLVPGRRLNFPEKAFSYDSFRPTEYYNDFLKPQHIHHKLIVNMVAEKKFYGRMVLTRPRRSKRFSKKEIQIAKSISPYLAHALAHTDFRKEIKLKGSLLEYIEKQSSVGMILLDKGLRIIYRNAKAVELCGTLKQVGSEIEQTDPIYTQLLKDCQKIKTSLKGSFSHERLASRQSVVKGSNQKRFLILSKILGQGTYREHPCMFMVSIREQAPGKINSQYLKNTFQLSNREIEVIARLSLGLKNAQIAGELYVSEITIKKHLQNIYDKVGVSNRTTLISRLFTFSGQDVI